jgi:hypothetical protein
VYYRQIEPELFLIYSEVKFKSNVCFRHVYNKSRPSDYYCLSLRLDYYAKVNNSMADGISYTDNSWLMFKPGARVNHHHFRGTRGKYFSVYFTPRWIKNYCKQIPAIEKKLLNLFLNSKQDYLICPRLSDKLLYNPQSLPKVLAGENPPPKKHLKKLKAEIGRFMNVSNLFTVKPCSIISGTCKWEKLFR